MPPRSFGRRQFLKHSSLLAGGLSLSSGARLALGAETKKPRFLIVVGATGGASLIDSVLAIRASESKNASTLNTYPDAVVSSPGTGAFRAVSYKSNTTGPIALPLSTDQAPFILKHESDLLAVTTATTSVNHAIAQRRAVTGNEAWQGRTLQELVAKEYGANALIPNAHLVPGSEFTVRGSDPSLPAYAYGEFVADPLLFPLSLHGHKGVVSADSIGALQKARALRDGPLTQAAGFSKTFGNAKAIAEWRALHTRQPELEKADLITKLMVAADQDTFPLGQYGLSSSPVGDKVRAVFPDYRKDPLEAQAALAYLLITQGVSVTVTLGVNFNFVFTGSVGLPGAGGNPNDPPTVRNLPVGFDFSHTSHQAAQAFMWRRVMKVADSLVGLLKATEFEAGESYWNRTLMFFATDFGRTKNRAANAPDFGSGHDLNNGSLILSPLVPGGRVLGGVDADTALTYGFDLTTGAPERGRTTSEKELFSGLLSALDVDKTGSGLPEVKAMRKG